MSRVVSNIAASNLAGDPTKRHSFLKSMIAAHAMDRSQESISDALRRGYAASPAVQLTGVQRWAKNMKNAGFVGQTYEAIDRQPIIQTSTSGASAVLLAPNALSGFAYPITVPEYIETHYLNDWVAPRVGGGPVPSSWYTDRAAHNLSMIYPFIGPPIYTYWARVYWRNHIDPHPENVSAPYTVAYDPATDTITMDSPGNWHWTFNPGIDPNGTYLYVLYQGDVGWNPYKLGTGDSVLEDVAAAVTGKPDSGYYPFIPVRLSNTSIASACSELHGQASRAFRKATASKFAKIVDQIDTNPQVGDIDMAMLTFGVQANTQNKFARRYIYEYLRGLWNRAGNPTGALAVTVGNDAPFPGGWGSQAGYGLTFKYLREETGTGVLGTVGNLWWETSGEEARLVWQDTSTTWRKMVTGTAIGQLTGLPGDGDAVGLWGEIYNSGETAFLFPLHRPTLTAIGVRNAAEAAQEALVLLTGSYTLITTSILSGIIFFISMVLVVAFPPGAAGVGLLGTNLAVGAAIGLTGSLAILAGAIINTLAAIIVMKLVTIGAKLVFGDKIGAIIGAVVGFLAVQVGTGLSNGMDMSTIWSNMTSATNLLQLTNAVGAGISGYVHAAMTGISEEMQAFNQAADDTLRSIQGAYGKYLGYDHGLIDPMNLIQPQTYFAESPNSFLTRTLLTGSDIAEMSHSMLTDFCDITLSTDLVLK